MRNFFNSKITKLFLIVSTLTSSSFSFAGVVVPPVGGGVPSDRDCQPIPPKLKGQVVGFENIQFYGNCYQVPLVMTKNPVSNNTYLYNEPYIYLDTSYLGLNPVLLTNPKPIKDFYIISIQRKRLKRFIPYTEALIRFKGECYIRVKLGSPSISYLKSVIYDYLRNVLRKYTCSQLINEKIRENIEINFRTSNSGIPLKIEVYY